MAGLSPSPLAMGSYRTLVGAWFVHFCTFGYINAFGVFQDHYTRCLLSNTSPSDISWIGSFQLFMMYAPGVLVGRAFDAGYFHHIMTSASILYVFSMFMLSFVQQHNYYQVFLTQALGMGIAQGMLFLPALTIVGHHFTQKRALATGFVVTGASAGGIVFPIMLNILATRFSFVFAIRMSATLVAVLLLLANSLMSSGIQKQQQQQQQRVSSVLFDTPYISSIVGAFFTNLGLFFPYFYLQLYSVEKGVPPQTAFYSLAILNAASVLGRLLPAFLADHLGVYNMLIPSLLISSIVLFAMLALNSLTSIVIFALSYGLASGAYVSLIPPLLAQLTIHVAQLGTRMGIAFSTVSVAMLIGTPIDGALLGHRLSWTQAIIFCGICVLVGSLLMTLSRYFFLRQRNTNFKFV